MIINWSEIVEDTKKIKDLTGLDLDKFNNLFDKFKEKLMIKKMRPYGKLQGRPLVYNDIKIRFLITYLYIRAYLTQRYLAIFFGIDQSQICRIIKEYVPILESILEIKDDNTADSVIVDATEQRIERPKIDQKKFYSGKKKTHTIKTEIKVARNGKILAISESVPGSCHDISLFKEQQNLCINKKIFADSGYQGIQKIYKFSEIPYKKEKGKNLTEDEKDYNKALSKIRVIVENVFAGIKHCRILMHQFRNNLNRYSSYFKIACGVYNYKNNFMDI
jgi:hypothetical protein